jgi:hypothetical protein
VLCLPEGVPTGITFSGASVGANAVCVAAMQAPGLSASNIWLLPDPTAAAAMPEGHAWPVALTAAHTASIGSSSSGAGGSGRSASARVAIGTSVGLVVALALLLAAVWYWYTKRRQQHRMLQQQQLPPGKAFELAVTPARAEGPLGADSTSCSLLNHQKKLGAVAGLAGAVAGSDASIDFDQASAHKQISEERLPANSPRNSDESERAGRPSTNSAAVSSSSQGRLAASAGSFPVRNSQGSSSLGCAGGSAQSESVDATGDSVSTGLERWKAAISLTTMKMMERRMQQLHTSPYSSASGSSSQQSPALAAAALAAPGAAAAAAAARRVSEGQCPGAGAAAGRAAGMGVRSRSSTSSGAESAAVPVQQPLRLQTLIGQGSFGSVYLGTW